MASDFYFAWVDAGTAFNPAVHNVEDEDVFSFTLQQAEGEFATLEIKVKNPKVGLLAVGRPRYAWFSFDDGTTVHPKFYGRLVGAPGNIFDELVVLNFVARPVDYIAQKTALANTMRTLPYYDPVFIAEDRRTDPDTVLEGRSAVWHINPVTHVVTTSDILQGEDGLIALAATDVIGDGLQLDISRVPITRVQVTATYTWQQRAYGFLTILDQFLITSYNDFEKNWPKVGTAVGDAWTIADPTYITALNPPVDLNTDVQFSREFPPEEEWSDSTISMEGVTQYSHNESGKKGTPGKSTVVLLETGSVITERDEDLRLISSSSSSEYQTKGFHIWNYNVGLTVNYNPTRQITEIIKFEMRADLQEVVSLPADDDLTVLDFQSVSLSETIPPTPGTEDDIINPAFPIGDTRLRSYTDTARGLQSLEYLLMCARAAVRNNSRAIKVQLKLASITQWLQVSLRKDMSYPDERLPGGGVTGKITAYSYSLDGDTGAFERTVTLECAVGRDGTWAAVAGTPEYAVANYTGTIYQRTVGGKNVVGYDVRYTVPTLVPQDDGRDLRRGFHKRDAQDVVVNEIGAQQVLGEELQAAMQTLLSESNSQWDPNTIWMAGNERPKNPFWQGYQYKFMKDFHSVLAASEYVTKYSFTLPFLNKDQTSTYTIQVEPMKLPRMVDLEAAV